MSILVPTMDLAPAVDSRIVTIKVTDLPEGGIIGEPGTVTFILPGDLRVPADDIIIRAGAVDVPLSETGEGQVRLPTHDPDAIGDGVGNDWYLLVKKSWTQQVDAIRIPAGTTPINLADINPVVNVTPEMGQWLLTNAGVEVVEGTAWAVAVTVSAGVAKFRFTVPPGGVSWARGGIGAGGEIDSIRGLTAVGQYRIDAVDVTGTPSPVLGSLEVLYNSASGRTSQMFTDIAAQTQFMRTYTNGAWTPWRPMQWNLGVLASAVDFDTVRTPGVRGVQFTNHPNAPVNVTGTLEVLPMAGSDLLQRFTTRATPPAVHRRTGSLAAWNAWSVEASGGGGGATPAPELANRVAALELLTRTSTITRTAVGSTLMTAMSRDGLRGWNAYTSTLSTTVDDGATWTTVLDDGGGNPFLGTTIESVRQLGNGELLVTAFRGSTDRREVWLTTGYPTSSSRPDIQKVMTGRARAIKFTSAWSQSDYGAIVLVNEYGPKMGEPWDGQEVLAGENARYTYLSTDSGKTWRTVFDLNTFLTGQMGRATANRQHLHGVAYDQWWERIWVSYGDNMGGVGSNGVAYSDDLGVTWHSAHSFSGPVAPNQVVGIIPMPKCILFGGDNGSPDVLRINRSEGKRTGTYPMPIAFDSSASGKHLCQAISRPAYLGDAAPTLMGFSSEGEDSPSFVVGTRDGYSFAEVWRDPASQSAGFGIRNVVGPTRKGEIILASNDLKVAGSWTEVRLRAPGYIG